ncbi:hypothetical protein K239x_29810 [Planctomycetes bacterium K23_9]|uniref:Uncharacterized protein n=1 Tax=Stieleria marina TaxID=1930275 RepID=A0A517NV33_9BACT|nr:hypothetical protein K239x_29810 [Planctomycetes bacterium K23_9]
MVLAASLAIQAEARHRWTIVRSADVARFDCSNSAEDEIPDLNDYRR